MVNETVEISTHIFDFNLDISNSTAPINQSKQLQRSFSGSTINKQQQQQQSKPLRESNKQEEDVAEQDLLTTSLNSRLLPNSADNLSWTFFEQVSSLDNQLRNDETNGIQVNGSHLMSNSMHDVNAPTTVVVVDESQTDTIARKSNGYANTANLCDDNFSQQTPDLILQQQQQQKQQHQLQYEPIQIYANAIPITATATTTTSTITPTATATTVSFKFTSPTATFKRKKQQQQLQQSNTLEQQQKLFSNNNNCNNHTHVENKSPQQQQPQQQPQPLLITTTLTPNKQNNKYFPTQQTTTDCKSNQHPQQQQQKQQSHQRTLSNVLINNTGHLNATHPTITIAAAATTTTANTLTENHTTTTRNLAFGNGHSRSTKTNTLPTISKQTTYAKDLDLVVGNTTRALLTPVKYSGGSGANFKQKTTTTTTTATKTRTRTRTRSTSDIRGATKRMGATLPTDSRIGEGRPEGGGVGGGLSGGADGGKMSSSHSFVDGIELQLGLVGWRKKCLYTLLALLMLLIITNLVLTLWILKVMEFSTEGMGQLKIVPGGVQLTGQALIMDMLRASTIRSRHGQPIAIESSRNFSINTRDTNGMLENHLFLGHDKLECLSTGFRINDTAGRNLFSVNQNEVTIGAHALRIEGEGGAIFRESIQTPHVRAEPGRELRLESPTRQLELTAAKDINLQSRAGGIELSALADVKLSALDGSLRLESSKILMPNLRTAQPPIPGTAQSRDHLHRVFQLCACSNGKLFLAAPHSICAGDDSTVCR